MSQVARLLNSTYLVQNLQASANSVRYEFQAKTQWHALQAIDATISGFSSQLRVEAMIPDSFLDQLSSKINELLPPELPHQVKKNLRALIEASFSKLDLVTREEFDVQKEVLLRTREKVDLLQKELARIEENLSD